MSPFANPQRYASPELLLDDASLSSADKKRLLVQWKLDLELELNATSENMPPLHRRADPQPAADASRSEVLRRVADCLRQVDKAA